MIAYLNTKIQHCIDSNSNTLDLTGLDLKQIPDEVLDLTHL